MQSTSDSSIIPIYIVNVHPMYIDNSIVWDVFYLTKESKELYCLRIYNIKLSFLVARFPAMNITQFIEYMKKYTNDIHTEIRTDLSDSSYFNLGNNREYMELFSESPYELNNKYKSICKNLPSVYNRIKVNNLNADDKLFYENTETPFRYTSTTLNISSTVYNLSTKYNVPLVGGATLNTEYIKQEYPRDYLPGII